MAGLVALTLGGAVLVLVPMLLAWAGRRFGEDHPDIHPPRQIFAGHDEALQQRTVKRRAQAEELKRAGRRVDTQDERPWLVKRRMG